jgi:hypothetical protein
VMHPCSVQPGDQRYNHDPSSLPCVTRHTGPLH